MIRARLRVLSLATLPFLGCVVDSLVSPDAGSDLGAVDLAPPRPDLAVSLFEWTGIIGTGQSLSVGVGGMPLISVAQPFANLKLVDPNFSGDLTGAAGAGAMLQPLVEPLRPFNNKFPSNNAYPNNLYGETPHPAMANELARLYKSATAGDYVTIHSAVGESGQSITVIRKNGTGDSYAAALYEARAITALAKQAGKRFGYGAIVLTHGETDWNDAMYEAEIRQLWMDYNSDLRAITGQSAPIPLLLSQQNTSPGAAGSAPSTLAEWKLGVDYPGQILCAGPKYQYEYASDHLHLTANGYRRLGQKYAQVYFQSVVLGQTWKPLQPRDLQQSGTALTLTFDVPVPPLRWDDHLPAPHQTLNKQWAAGRGFEASDQRGPLGITAVDIVAPDQVKITVDRTPEAGLVVAYAMTQDVTGYTGGLPESRGGQLRDSADTVGYDVETIDCKVQNGSNMVTPAGAADFARRSVRDVATSAQLASDTVITAKPGATQLTLSAPWTGPSGTAQLDFHNDLHNYCVQFSLPSK